MLSGLYVALFNEVDHPLPSALIQVVSAFKLLSVTGFPVFVKKSVAQDCWSLEPIATVPLFVLDALDVLDVLFDAVLDLLVEAFEEPKTSEGKGIVVE